MEMCNSQNFILDFDFEMPHPSIKHRRVGSEGEFKQSRDSFSPFVHTTLFAGLLYGLYYESKYGSSDPSLEQVNGGRNFWVSEGSADAPKVCLRV